MRTVALYRVIRASLCALAVEVEEVKGRTRTFLSMVLDTVEIDILLWLMTD